MSEGEDRKKVMEAFIEAKKLEAYAEHRTREMRVCHLCGTVAYKRLRGVSVGARWMCIGCLKALKEALDSFAELEEEMRFEAEIRRKME